MPRWSLNSTFHNNPSDYPHIDTDAARLVVYFSRMGYVKKAACEAADRTGACLYEVKSTERTEGTLGFWWCGRYGTHRWDMPIERIAVDLKSYCHVTVCSPILVFHLAAPMRAFCRAASGQIKEADYILVHHQSAAYQMPPMIWTRSSDLKTARLPVSAAAAANSAVPLSRALPKQSRLNEISIRISVGFQKKAVIRIFDGRAESARASRIYVRI